MSTTEGHQTTTETPKYCKETEKYKKIKKTTETHKGTN